MTTPTTPSESRDDGAPPAEERLNDWLRHQSDLTIATAESCTGGNVAARLTRVAGSSAYVLGGIVAYANSAKARLLGVPEALLVNPGAVSEPTARAMAEGARRVFDATFSVASTGIAGPKGGTARKPVGLVYLAVAGPDGVVVQEHHFSGDRAAITAAATDAALEMLAYVVRQRLE